MPDVVYLTVTFPDPTITSVEIGCQYGPAAGGTYFTSSDTVPESGAMFYISGAGADVIGTAPTARNGMDVSIKVVWAPGATKRFILAYVPFSGLGEFQVVYVANPGTTLFLRLVSANGDIYAYQQTFTNKDV